MIFLRGLKISRIFHVINQSVFFFFFLVSTNRLQSVLSQRSPWSFGICLCVEVREQSRVSGINIYLVSLFCFCAKYAKKAIPWDPRVLYSMAWLGSRCVLLVLDLQFMEIWISAVSIWTPSWNLKLVCVCLFMNTGPDSLFKSCLNNSIQYYSELQTKLKNSPE